MITRRSLLVALFSFAALPAACKKEQRCPHCGMKLDPTSPWRADLVLAGGARVSYDTPRCALSDWRAGKAAAQAVSVQEFYDRTWMDGALVRFVAGSDVLGPMGADLVPVAAERAAKFTKDHGGRPLALAEVTPQAIKDLQ